jgi:hypothetical protein
MHHTLLKRLQLSLDALAASALYPRLKERAIVFVY